LLAGEEVWLTRWRGVAGLLALIVAGSAHVSAPRPRPGTYVVRRGDTLARVARRTGVPVAALARANGIANANRIRAGAVLVVPAGLAPLPSPVVVATGGRAHRVRNGESLAAIAARYGTTVGDLARANGIRRANLVRAGTRLHVPGPPWLCPVQGRRVDFSDGWGQPRPGGRRHLGVDLFAFRGTPVVASVSGVLFHRNGSRAGLAYELRGVDGNTYYGAHLHTMVARPGAIARGALIGTVGSTGNAHGTTPHLHFEFRPGGGAQVNPYYTLRRWC
jgi:murein DD-endopeptidase MepM/ murein hydrolase activator NlpD